MPVSCVLFSSALFPVEGNGLIVNHVLSVVPGSILSITTQYVRETEQVKVLALCGGEDGRMTDGSLLTVFVLPVKELAGVSPVVADLIRQHLTHSRVWFPPTFLWKLQDQSASTETVSFALGSSRCACTKCRVPSRRAFWESTGSSPTATRKN